MADGPNTTFLRNLVQRMQAGEREAQDELIRGIGARMELLCRKMLNRFDRLRPLHETGDVMQNACLRPETTTPIPSSSSYVA